MKKKSKIKIPSYVNEIATSAHILAEMHGGYDYGEHPEYSYKRWLREVKRGETLKGYWEWAASFI